MGKIGWHPTEEMRSKMRETHRGKPRPLEVREKIRATLKGNMPWNKGKTGLPPLSEEHKRKIGRALLGERNPNFGKPINLGKRLSEETKTKISESHKGAGNPNFGKFASEETNRRRSTALRGQTRSEETKRKMSEIAKVRYRDKSNHPRWKGGRSFIYYPPEFDETMRRAVRKRDNSICQCCGAVPAKIVHHIDYDRQNNTAGNLVTLCASCHSRTNARRAFWTGFFIGLMAARVQSAVSG